jgi:hypothetical protein
LLQPRPSSSSRAGNCNQHDDAGDFDISRELGRRFLAGEHLYAGGLHYPYMPTAAMFFAPLALFPPWLGFALRYTAALGCLWLTLHWLARMTRPRSDADMHDAGVMGLTVLLAAHYILRDLDDGGPHLLLLAAVVGGLWGIDRHRLGLGAAALGFAIAVKAPHGLLLLFFAWQRRWRLTLVTAAAAAAWIVLPSVWMGPTSWWHHQVEWSTTVAASVRGAPLPGPRDSEERVQNQALAPAVVRIVRHLGEPEHAPWLGAAASVAVLAGLIGATRRSPPIASAAWLRQVSSVLIAMPLLAPVAWVQHLVVVIPGLFLILTTARATPTTGGARSVVQARMRRHPPWTRWRVLPRSRRGRTRRRVSSTPRSAFMLLALVLNREVLGRSAYLELLTWGLHTVALLLLLAILLLPQPRWAPRSDGRMSSAPHNHVRVSRWVLASVAFGLACRVRQYLANTSLWHDESFVALNALHTSYPDLLRARDWDEPSPPAFLLIEKLVVAALGPGEHALRLVQLTGLIALAGSWGSRAVSPAAAQAGSGGGAVQFLRRLDRSGQLGEALHLRSVLCDRVRLVGAARASAPAGP